MFAVRDGSLRTDSYQRGEEMSKRYVCPQCGEKLKRKKNMYCWREIWLHGWVCVPCQSLVDVYGSFFRYVEKVSGKPKAERER